LSRDTLPRSLWLLVAVLSVVWGMNWPVLKLVIAEVPVWTFRSLCFFAAFAGLVPIALARGVRVMPREGWARIAAVGFFTVTAANVLLMLGMPMLPAGRSAVLYYTMPVWSVLLSAWWLDERLTLRRALGLVAGLAAVLLIASPGFTGAEVSIKGVLLVLSGALCWAVGTVLQKRLPVPLPSISYAAWVMLIGGLPIFVLVPLFEPDALQAVAAASPAAQAGIVYNMALVFVFGWWAWIRIVERAPAGVAALSSLMTPVVGVIGGMLMLGERPLWQDYAGLGLVTLAMASVMLPARRG